ncbi:hypothetical protein [Asticcacaulis biprosthecium]|nr:hypothetical protein [Asticcacaulis biprosthecium]
MRNGKRVREKYVEAVCEALDLQSEFKKELRKNAVADDRFGGYRLGTLPDYEGTYIEIRRSFSKPSELVRTLYFVNWDQAIRALSFEHLHEYQTESGMKSFQHTGQLAICPSHGYVSFVTLDRGAVRIATVTGLPNRGAPTQEMAGGLFTRRVASYRLTPAFTSVILKKIDGGVELTDQKKQMMGRLRLGDLEFEYWDKRLESVEKELIYVTKR